VLAGIGGNTIARAKAAISYPEYLAWLKYRELHGPLNLHPRLDRAAALVAYTVNSTVPRKPGAGGPKFEDFVPQYGAGDQPITLQEAMRAWT